MPTLTNAAVRPALEALQVLVNEILPFPTAFAMRDLIRELQARAEDIEAERAKLVDEHAARDEEGHIVAGPEPGTVQIAEEHYATFRARYDELMATPWEATTSLSKSLLTEVRTSTATLLKLGDLLTDDETQ